MMKHKTIVMTMDDLKRPNNYLILALDKGYKLVSNVAFPVAVSSSGKGYTGKEALGEIVFILRRESSNETKTF